MKKRSCPLQPGSLVWAYARDSGGNNQELSVRQQVEQFREYCKRFGLTLARVFTDEARRGSSLVGRDAFDDMLQQAKQEPRPVDGIILWCFSRFARNLNDAQYHKSGLRRRGYVLISLGDEVPEGEYAPIVEVLIDWKNERYLRDLGRDVTRGLHDLAERGFAPGGRPPKGYMPEKVVVGQRRDGSPHIVSRWVIDPEKVDLVRTAWTMRSRGASYAEIHEATLLHRSKSSYASMFANETYRGVRKCGELRIERGLEPIIDDGIWEAVQALRRQHTRRQCSPGEHPRRRSSPYLLSGLAVCALCGAMMNGGTDNVRRGCPWIYYLCARKKREGWGACPSGRVNGRLLHQGVLDTVTARILTPAYVLALVERVNETLLRDNESLDKVIREAERRITGVDRAIGNLLDLAERHGANAAAARILEREREREELIQHLRQLERRQELSQLQVDPETVKAILTRMQWTLASGSLQAKRKLLKSFVQRVEVGGGDVRLFYTFPLPEVVPPVADSLVRGVECHIDIDLGEADLRG
jgi:DNA invertase Pin-like site-specific DNA recombinase